MSVQAHASRRIDALLAEYGESHQNPTNKLIHWFAVPVIAWTVLALLWIALVLFAVAWVLQFVGHHVEGKKPSFLRDIQFLMVGPAWLMHFLYRRAGIPY